MSVVSQEYIEIDDRGITKLIGVGAKVRMIAVEHNQGMTAEQIQEAHPHLSLPQIHAALAYYYDHKDEVDANIEEGRKYVKEMRATRPNRISRDELIVRWKALYPGRPVPGEVTDEE